MMRSIIVQTATRLAFGQTIDHLLPDLVSLKILDSMDKTENVHARLNRKNAINQS